MDQQKINQQLESAIESAAISGLCRDGQVEIAAQTARQLQPNQSEEALLRQARIAYQQYHQPDQHS